MGNETKHTRLLAGPITLVCSRHFETEKMGSAIGIPANDLLNVTGNPVDHLDVKSAQEVIHALTDPRTDNDVDAMLSQVFSTFDQLSSSNPDSSAGHFATLYKIDNHQLCAGIQYRGHP